jgi:hypothetical protein
MGSNPIRATERGQALGTSLRPTTLSVPFAFALASSSMLAPGSSPMIDLREGGPDPGQRLPGHTNIQQANLAVPPEQPRESISELSRVRRVSAVEAGSLNVRSWDLGHHLMMHWRSLPHLRPRIAI